MSLHYSRSPLGEDIAAAEEEHEERMRDLQHAVCDRRGPAGPCDRCEACALLRRAVEWHGDPFADLMGDVPPDELALCVIGRLAREVGDEQRRRVRAEQDASWARGRADRLELALAQMETRLAAQERETDRWRRECWAAQEDGEAA